MIKIGCPIKFDGTLVIIRDYYSKLWYDYEYWIRDNCNGRVCSDNYGSSRFFVFENPEDASAFKLRWI